LSGAYFANELSIRPSVDGMVKNVVEFTLSLLSIFPRACTSLDLL